MRLNQEQIDQFNRDGYVFMPECFSRDEAALLRREADVVYAQDREEVWREKDGSTPRTAFAAHLYNEAFRRLGAHPRLIEPVEQLLDGKLYMHQYKVNAKAAFDGDVWQWHQDFGTWHRDDGMPEPRAMNIAVFLDEVTEFNGPLMFIPGSHRDGVFEAGHDLQSTSYPLWTLDKAKISRYSGAKGACRQRHRLPRLPGPRLQPEYLTLGPDHRLPEPLRGFEPHHQVPARRLDRAPRFYSDPGAG